LALSYIIFAIWLASLPLAFIAAFPLIMSTSRALGGDAKNWRVVAIFASWVIITPSVLIGFWVS